MIVKFINITRTVSDKFYFYIFIAGLGAGLHFSWCGAGLNIEVCGAVRAPTLNDGAVRVQASSLWGGAVAVQPYRPAQGSSVHE